MTVPQLTLNNGVTMPALGFGVFQTPPAETSAAVATAFRTGYRHIDTAAAYRNERGVGEALRASGLSRAEVFLETKIWINDYGYEETLHSFDKSAGKLGVDQIEVHPYFTQPEVQALGAEHGNVTQAWAPIGGITFHRDSGHRSTLDALDTGKRGGPEPADISLKTFSLTIPEA
jgi:diketogulonate reductase-like aldo/keto reductase